VRAGQRVLINGAGGGAGSFAVQIAKSLGAEVTGVDSAQKLDMMRAIGADRAIDYAREDFTRGGERYDLILDLAIDYAREDFTRGGERYDLILDLAAYRSIFACRRALAPGGIYLMAGGAMAQLYQALFLGPLISRAGKQKLGALMADTRREDLEALSELYEAGTVVPVIDRCYPLGELGGALRYIGEGHAAGKVVIVP
jgi:NADPH:quinone reductase-like Zn-dependent oxidoreductase